MTPTSLTGPSLSNGEGRTDFHPQAARASHRQARKQAACADKPLVGSMCRPRVGPQTGCVCRQASCRQPPALAWMRMSSASLEKGEGTQLRQGCTRHGFMGRFLLFRCLQRGSGRRVEKCSGASGKGRHAAAAGVCQGVKCGSECGCAALVGARSMWRGKEPTQPGVPPKGEWQQEEEERLRWC